MRVTNMMTSNQMLLNLNKTMNSLSFLQYQSATGNKIRYASDNPIIAGRSLKFRTNIVEVEQFMSNVNQGRSWLQTSALAVKNVFEALSNSGETSIRSLLVSAGGTTTVDDCKIFSNQFRETLGEIKAELNASYAGRSIFSGYKTDEKPIFDTDSLSKSMIINQSFSLNDIQADYKVYSKVDNSGATPVADNTAMPQEISCIRLKLAYDVGISDINGFIPGVTIKELNSSGNALNSSDPEAYIPDPNEINFIKDTGELIFGSNVYKNMQDDIKAVATDAAAATDAALKAYQASELNNTKAGAQTALTAAQDALTAVDAMIATASGNSALNSDSYEKLTDARKQALDAKDKAQSVVDAYNALAADPESIPLQKALSEAKYQAKQSAQDSNTTATRAANATQAVEIMYTKSGFKTGELNPKVYFDCMEVDKSRKYDMDEQSIMYQFGTNNKMQINSLAKNLLTVDMVNDISDVVRLIDNVTLSDLDDLITKLRTEDPALSYDEAKKLADAQITDENKFYMDLIGNACTKLIGKLDNHATELSRENTSIGSRLSRLDLIYNRLEDDRVNYEDLKSENDLVDADEAYIRFSSMLAVYQSALQTGAKVIQMSLVNYI